MKFDEACAKNRGLLQKPVMHKTFEYIQEENVCFLFLKIVKSKISENLLAWHEVSRITSAFLKIIQKHPGFERFIQRLKKPEILVD